MINAAIIGLGRWGQILVNSVQGKSDKIKIIAGRTETLSDNAKEDQRRQMAHHGGPEAMLNAGTFAMSPIPGKDVEIESLT